MIKKIGKLGVGVIGKMFYGDLCARIELAKYWRLV